MPTEVVKERSRRPRARHRDVIFGALDERIAMLQSVSDTNGHGERIRELLDELRRSLGKDSDEPRD